MNNISISSYLKHRTFYHANLYQCQIHDDFRMTVFDETIFDIMFFIVQEYLRQGHTVVILSKNWQNDIIDIIITHINNELGFLFDINPIFSDIDKYFDDLVQLKNIINKALLTLKSYHKEYQLSTLYKQYRNDIENQQFIEKLSQQLLWVLRFYYYTKHKMNHALSALADVLVNHCFFGQSYRSDRPIIWVYQSDKDEIYLWLNRIYHTEKRLLERLSTLHQSTIDKMTSQNLNPNLNAEQQQAVHAIFNHSISIITGGPGTGKTFTIAQAVQALYQNPQNIELALVAPTGKAAQRMKESLADALLDSEILFAEPMTIHRLLGIGKSGVPRYTSNNPLPFDLVIVDEASMIGVELAEQLLGAIKSGARLVLLGDTHQLFAVEAGSVLSDLCALPIMKENHVQLVQSRRFHEQSGVGQLAHLVNANATKSSDDIIRLVCQYDELLFNDIKKLSKQDIRCLYESIIAPYEQNGGYFELTKRLRYIFYKASDDKKHEYLKILNDKFNKYRILCASHLSECGDNAINQHIKAKHQIYLNIPEKNIHRFEWYHGRPVMILKNRYDLGLFNGDIGICLQTGKRFNDLTVFFYGDTIKSFPISMLSGDVANTAYAMTIHKSQGSEFDIVAVVCHDVNGQLLSKELLYTAITRAKQQVHLYSTPTALTQAINQPTIRHTGLRLHKMIG